MNKLVFLSCSLLVTTQLSAQNDERTLKEITVSGNGYERGLMHGRQLKSEIADVIAAWRANTAREINRVAPDKDIDQVLKEFFEYASFEEAIHKWTPDLWDEVNGIATASGQAFRDVYVLNLLDEFWVYLDQLEHHHCSSLGIPAQAGQPTRIAQNMDLEHYTDGYQVLMRIEGDDTAPEQMILTHAGLIALNGLNEDRIGVCVNTLMQLKAENQGLPVAFVVRALLAKRDKESVLKLIREVDHASGQNYILGVDDEVFDFEASANRVDRLRIGNANGTVYHTNHPLVNEDLKDWVIGWDDPAAYTDANLNSALRLAAVARRLKASIDTQTIKNALRSRDHADNPVCRTHMPNGGGFTFASTIMSLGEQPTLQLTVGPPDESEYRTFTFERASGTRSPSPAPARFRAHDIADLRGGYAVSLADFNNDGRLDVMANSLSLSEVAWHENPTWDRHVIVSGMPGIVNHAMADLDADGIPEVAFQSAFAMQAANSEGLNWIARHQGDPRGEWSVEQIDKFATSHHVTWADLDGDGDLELVNAPLIGPASLAPTYDQDITPVFWYDQEGWQRQIITEDVPGLIHRVRTVRWGPGSRDQILMASFEGITLFGATGEGDGMTFRKEILSPGHVEAAPRLGASDVGTGFSNGERIVASVEPWHGNEVVVYTESGGKWQRRVIFDQITRGHEVAVGDLNGDGRADIVANDNSRVSARNPDANSGVHVFFSPENPATGEWIYSKIESEAAMNSCAIGDMNQDGRPDIVCTGGGGVIRWYENLGS